MQREPYRQRISRVNRYSSGSRGEKKASNSRYTLLSDARSYQHKAPGELHRQRVYFLFSASSMPLLGRNCKQCGPKNGIIGYVRTISKRISAHGRSFSIEQLFPVEREYARCVTALNRTSILTLLPQSESIGMIGRDGKEYPIPTQEQVVALFAHNSELVGRKVPQGFDRLELTPMAMPTPLLIDRMKAAILKHAVRKEPWT